MRSMLLKSIGLFMCLAIALSLMCGLIFGFRVDKVNAIVGENKTEVYDLENLSGFSRTKGQSGLLYSSRAGYAISGTVKDYASYPAGGLQLKDSSGSMNGQVGNDSAIVIDVVAMIALGETTIGFQPQFDFDGTASSNKGKTSSALYLYDTNHGALSPSTSTNVNIAKPQIADSYYGFEGKIIIPISSFGLTLTEGDNPQLKLVNFKMFTNMNYKKLIFREIKIIDNFDVSGNISEQLINGNVCWNPEGSTSMASIYGNNQTNFCRLDKIQANEIISYPSVNIASGVLGSDTLMLRLPRTENFTLDEVESLNLQLNNKGQAGFRILYGLIGTDGVFYQFINELVNGGDPRAIDSSSLAMGKHSIKLPVNSENFNGFNAIAFYPMLFMTTSSAFAVNNPGIKIDILSISMDRNSYDIHATSNGYGSVNLSSNEAYYDQDITFTLIPNEGYGVKSATLNGNNVVIENNQYTAKNVKQALLFNVIFEPIVENRLEITHDNNNLTVSVKYPMTGYEYQYWIYEKTDVDNFIGDNYIWQLAPNGGYSNETSLTFLAKERYLDKDGNYRIMVRVKDSQGNFLEQLCEYASKEQVGQVGITSISVNGEISEKIHVINKSLGIVNIKVNAYNATSIVASNGAENLTSSANVGEFTWNTSSLKDGWYNLKFVAGGDNGSEERELKVYVYGEYVESETPVMYMAVNNNDLANPVFTLETKNADGAAITNLENYVYEFTVNGKRITADSVNKNVFSVNLKNNYGVHVVHAKVRRANVTGIDDESRMWYDYKRSNEPIIATMTAKNSNQETVKEINKNEPLVITGNATIPGVNAEDVLYSYVKYDAKGWTIIKNYSTDKTLNWQPLRGGTYKIYLRVKGKSSNAMYEKEIATDYVVIDELSTISGSVELGIFEYNGGAVATNITARKPYCVRAAYMGTEEVVYKFMLWDRDMKTVIAQQYSPDNEYIFIARKDVAYKVTVQVISVNGYGYMEIESPLDIE